MQAKNIFALIFAPLLSLIFGILSPLGESPEVNYTLAVAFLMAVWWVSEVVPIAVTSLLPVVLFPLLGIMNGKAVSATYFNHVIFLFLGGFLIALAMQKWNLHKRIALRILMFTGAGAGRILLGFMLATAFLSMWISNTATAMMLVPVVLSVIERLEASAEKARSARYSIGLLLGVAYSASIGGMATLVGTPPNLVFARIFAISFPAAPEISFAQWFAFALPLSLLFLLLLFLYLYLLFVRKQNLWGNFQPGNFRREYQQLGRMSYEEKAVAVVFALFALLLLFRAEINLGFATLPGWSELFPQPAYINDGTVAILLSVALFLIPARSAKGTKLIDWNLARQLPWRIVLLFGGGFALAAAFKESGLSQFLGESLVWVSHIHPFGVIVVIAFLMTFLTEMTSNTATSQIVLPVLAALAVSVEVNPLLFMIPATLSGSMAFMLPIATPPNAIVFGAGKIQMRDMIKAGVALNFIGVLLVSLGTYFFATYIFGIDLSHFPKWAIF